MSCRKWNKTSLPPCRWEELCHYAMLNSCPAARRVAQAAAIAVVMVCVGSAVVAAAFPFTCVPSLRKLVAISPPPCISKSNASHTPTLVRVAVWRLRSARNHPPPAPPRPPLELPAPTPL